MDRLNRQAAEEVLLSRGWLSRQTEGFQAELSRWSVVQSMEAGSTVYRLNDPPGGIYGLVSGALAVSFETVLDGPRLLQHGALGSWIGVVPFLTGGPRLAELSAATDCVVLHVPLAAMEAMAARDPAAVRAFAQIAVENIASLLALLGILLLPTAERRIAASLIRAAESGSDPIPMTQADLAGITNASLRQVSAALRNLARQGLIEPGYRAIRVLDADGLGKRAMDDTPPRQTG